MKAVFKCINSLEINSLFTKFQVIIHSLSQSSFNNLRHFLFFFRYIGNLWRLSKHVIKEFLNVSMNFCGYAFFNKISLVCQLHHGISETQKIN